MDAWRFTTTLTLLPQDTLSWARLEKPDCGLAEVDLGSGNGQTRSSLQEKEYG